LTSASGKACGQTPLRYVQGNINPRRLEEKEEGAALTIGEVEPQISFDSSALLHSLG
jgi:hypothetical protein